ncbi:MAG: nicotinate (nicotinamide) nucleotide adenylyltransferase [Eubacteriales bacterium]
MHIGIFGGTFNPPHLGHAAVIRESIHTLELDRLLLIPSAIPPHKEIPEHSPSPEIRLALLEQMLDLLKHPTGVEICTLELERKGPSYTSDTVAELRSQYPEATFTLLVGEDMFLSLQTWHTPEEVLSDVNLCAFMRGDTPPSQALHDQATLLKETYGVDTQFLTLSSGMPSSSTQVRSALPDQPPYLQPPIYGTILRLGLYGCDGNLKGLPLNSLRFVALSFLKAKRIPHVLGVEQECAKLAEHWGYDPILARRAGLLHDCTKFWTYDQHVAYCKEHNLALDELELETDKLLHAKSGACMARDLLGETEEVWQSILWHTTGRGDMTLLDKILYIADYIEVNRDFPEVHRLRELSYQDLDSAMRYGLEITLQEMKDRNKVTHQNTKNAYASLTKAKGGQL